MSIVRAKRTDRGFLIVDNAVIRDEQLSYRARGLLAAILSRPDDWRTDYKTLAREGKEGESAVRAALKELRATGYIVQTKRQTTGGRWETITEVFDHPQEVSPQVAPSVGKPKPGEPKPGDPTPIPNTETEHRHEDGSDDPNVGLPAGSTAPRPTERAKPRKPTQAQQERMNADFGELIRLCKFEDVEDPYSVWWTLRLEHKVTSPAKFMAQLVERDEWDGFVGRHGITPYLRSGKAS